MEPCGVLYNSFVLLRKPGIEQQSVWTGIEILGWDSFFF